MRQGGTLVGGRQRLIDQVRQLRLAGHPPAGQVEAADDDRQQVVEVMGHAAGQLADRLHLLSLAQQVLGPLLLPQVACEGAEDASLLGDESHNGEFNRKGSYIAVGSEEHTSELQSLMRLSYAVFRLN